jgi:hypothetical protein
MTNAEDSGMERHDSKDTFCDVNQATKAAYQRAYEIGHSIAVAGEKLARESVRSPFTPSRQ